LLSHNKQLRAWHLYAREPSFQLNRLNEKIDKKFQLNVFGLTVAKKMARRWLEGVEKRHLIVLKQARKFVEAAEDVRKMMNALRVWSESVGVVEGVDWDAEDFGVEVEGDFVDGRNLVDEGDWGLKKLEEMEKGRG
jgi:hypothetical protein